MVRVEVTLPLVDNNRNPIHRSYISRTIAEIYLETKGYYWYLRTGAWRDEEENVDYGPDEELTVVSETNLEKINWFLEKRPCWTKRFKQKEIHLVISCVER